MTSKIVGVYLAAGLGTRFGGNKLSVPFGNKSLGAYALSTALATMLDKIIVVVNKEVPLNWLHNELMNNEKLMISYCENSHKGQSYTVKCGIKKANEMGAHSIVILLADQPFVSKELINRLITHQQKFPSLKFIAATKDSIICLTVLMNKKITTQMMHMSGDSGKKKILEQEKKQGMLIEVHNQYELFDIDTKEDYYQALCCFEAQKLNERVEAQKSIARNSTLEFRRLK